MSEPKKKRRVTPEGKVKAYFVKLLNLAGIPYSRNQSGAGAGFGGRWIVCGMPGIPDFVVFSKKSSCHWVEIKSSDTKPYSESQHAWIELTGMEPYKIGSKETASTMVMGLHAARYGYMTALIKCVNDRPENTLILSSAFASSLIKGGVSSWEAERTRLLGNTSSITRGPGKKARGKVP